MPATDTFDTEVWVRCACGCEDVTRQAMWDCTDTVVPDAHVTDDGDGFGTVKPEHR